MDEWPELDDPHADVEALLRGAGNYVQPSEDLRPRVLESAHAAKQRSRARRRMCQIGVIAICLAFIISSFASPNPDAATNRTLLTTAAPHERTDSVWATADAARDLRMQQAAFFQLWWK